MTEEILEFKHLPGGEQFFISKLVSSQAETLQAMMETCQDFALLSDGLPVQPDAAREIFTEVPPGRSTSDKIVLGVWVDAHLAGVVDLLRDYPDPRVWWIGLMEFAPVHRGKHLGSSVLTEVEVLARQQGATSLQLGVLEANQAGLSFWSRLGFTEIRRKTDYQSGLKTHTVIVMEKLL